jgi:hypothetical protein
MNANAGPTDFNFYLSSDLHLPVSLIAYWQRFPLFCTAGLSFVPCSANHCIATLCHLYVSFWITSTAYHWRCCV